MESSCSKCSSEGFIKTRVLGLWKVMLQAVRVRALHLVCSGEHISDYCAAFVFPQSVLAASIVWNSPIERRCSWRPPQSSAAVSSPVAVIGMPLLEAGINLTGLFFSAFRRH